MRKADCKGSISFLVRSHISYEAYFLLYALAGTARLLRLSSNLEETAAAASGTGVVRSGVHGVPEYWLLPTTVVI